MKTAKERSKKQEKSVAKSFNAKVTVASGAMWGMKGDVRNDKFLIECKTTKKGYYTLTTKVWEKIQEEAIKDHLRIPLMVIDLKDSERYVVFRPQDFNNQTVIPVYPDKIYRENSFKIMSSLFGYNKLGYYVSAYYFILGDKQSSVLCVMMYKDFKEQFEEEL